MRVTLQPAAGAVFRVGSVLSSRSLTASVHSAFCAVGAHISNEVRAFTTLAVVIS